MRNTFIANSKIIIYGDGVVGKKTLAALQKKGVSSCVLCFTKSERNFSPYKTEGYDVLPLEQLSQFYKSAIFLIAVSEKYRKEILKNIKKLKIKHYVYAKKIYADSYKVSAIYSVYRNIRNRLYIFLQKRNFFSARVPKKVAHITYPLVGNTGDTVLSWCVRKFFAAKKYEIKKVSDAVDENYIADINRNDLLLIGGGGIFLPDTNSNCISGWEWAISNSQIDDIKIPIAIFSVGFNYFKNQVPSELFIKSVSYIIEKSSFVGLRNTGSVKVVQSLIPDSIKNKVVYQPCTTTLIRKICKTKHKNNTKKVCFNVAFDRSERRFGNSMEQILKEIAMAAKLLADKGYMIYYAAHCDDDMDFLPYLDGAGVKYKKKNFTQSLPYEVIRFYSKIQCAIGMRGHAQMIPFGCGCRIISLGTHDKMRWFLEDIDALDWYVDLQADRESICQKIVSIFSVQNEVCPAETDFRLEAEQEKLYDISVNNLDKIKQFIERGDATWM